MVRPNATEERTREKERKTTLKSAFSIRFECNRSINLVSVLLLYISVSRHYRRSYCVLATPIVALSSPFRPTQKHLLDRSIGRPTTNSIFIEISVHKMSSFCRFFSNFFFFFLSFSSTFLGEITNWIEFPKCCATGSAHVCSARALRIEERQRQKLRVRARGREKGSICILNLCGIKNQ